MKSMFLKLLHRLTFAALAFALSVGVVAHAQPEAQADTQTQNSLGESLGEAYKAPDQTNPKLVRVTLYRTNTVRTGGVAHLDINSHYHTSLQSGGFSEVCFPSAKLQIAARMVQIGVDEPNAESATLSIQTTPRTYVRIDAQRNGLVITPVGEKTALAELQNTRRQIHAATRLEQAQACEETVVAANETIVLGSDALFGFGKSDIKGITDKGRADLDQLIAHLQDKYDNQKGIVFNIVGHADALGQPAANQRLSLARAQAIRAYLIEGGIRAPQITAEGAGADQLIVTTCGKTATPDTIACNKPNRRVVVNVRTAQ